MNLLELTKQLISLKSVTPNDMGCQNLIANFLTPLGFSCEHIQIGSVSNLWAKFGCKPPLFVFAGHTDVVDPGDYNAWNHDPFTLVEQDGFIYGRGIADMKGAISAFLIATKDFILSNPQYCGSIALLITSDEEGKAKDGTKKICKILKSRGEKINFCLIGEPTSTSDIGDSIKHGRRGSLSGEIVVYGCQGHIAYNLSESNPIHIFSRALLELTQKKWDNGNDFFSPTSFQFFNIKTHNAIENLTPSSLIANFNFRFSKPSTPSTIKCEFNNILMKYGFSYKLKWHLNAMPFLTKKEGILAREVRKSIQAETGINSAYSTEGGTSDGRFLSKICLEVIELGLTNSYIHKVNERVKTCDLYILKNIYNRILNGILVDNANIIS